MLNERYYNEKTLEAMRQDLYELLDNSGPLVFEPIDPAGGHWGWFIGANNLGTIGKRLNAALMSIMFKYRGNFYEISYDDDHRLTISIGYDPDNV